MGISDYKQTSLRFWFTFILIQSKVLIRDTGMRQTLPLIPGDPRP